MQVEQLFAAERGRSAAHRQLDRAAAGRPQLRQRRRDDQDRTRPRCSTRSNGRSRSSATRSSRSKVTPTRSAATNRIWSCRNAAPTPCARICSRTWSSPRIGSRRWATAKPDRSRATKRPTAARAIVESIWWFCAVVTETRIGAQRAGLLLATILCHGCAPPDPAATTSAALPRHVAAAPRPVGAAQPVSTTQTAEANDADARCRLATRLTENVESCLSVTRCRSRRDRRQRRRVSGHHARCRRRRNRMRGARRPNADGLTMD